MKNINRWSEIPPIIKGAFTSTVLAGLRWTLRSWTNLNSLVVSDLSASLEGYNAAYLTHILLLQTLASQVHVLFTQLHKKRQRTHYLSFSTLKLKNTQEHPAKNQRKGLPVKSFIETFTLLSSNRKRTDPYFTDVNEDKGNQSQQNSSVQPIYAKRFFFLDPNLAATARWLIRSQPDE